VTCPYNERFRVVGSGFRVQRKREESIESKMARMRIAHGGCGWGGCIWFLYDAGVEKRVYSEHSHTT
jgi:hypothetical protein